jgi:farnesyl-diphosphate farnesyltransferase
VADFQDLLVKTSRTFALSIPVLDEPMRREVTLAYLLFRIADTFEDAWVWPKKRRVEELHALGRLLEDYDEAAVREASLRWLEERPCEHEGYLELLAEAPAVLAAWAGLEELAREAVARHTVRTCEGMARFVDRADEGGRLRLEDLEELRAYCYVVAGIVGEVLTELFLLHDRGLAEAEDELTARATTFGEALQLVNILKDAADDAQEGRTFLPPGTDREEIFALARSDLECAEEYVLLLQEHGSSRGAVEFTALPVLLAWETLSEVERRGAGAKVSRERVATVVDDLNRRLDQGLPAVGPTLRGAAETRQ